MARRGNRRNGRAGPGDAAGKPAFPGPLQLPAKAGPAGSSAAELAKALKRHDERRLAAAAARGPLDFRAGHPAIGGDGGVVVERFGRSLPDAEGAVGNPHRTYDTLATLRRNGSISAAEHDAGRQFEDDFALASLDPLHASNPARIRSSGVSEITEAMVAGRRRVGRAMAALGGTATAAGSAVWCVLGSGQTVKEWAATRQFGRNGRSLDEKVAKGVFVAALGVLAVHYGKLKPSRGR